MSQNKGMLVEYTKADNTTKRAIVYYSDQHKKFTDLGKVLITHVDKNLIPLKDDKGKKITALKKYELLKIIGYLD